MAIESQNATRGRVRRFARRSTVFGRERTVESGFLCVWSLERRPAYDNSERESTPAHGHNQTFVAASQRASRERVHTDREGYNNHHDRKQRRWHERQGA